MEEETNQLQPPSWEDAPEWANYLTVDELGCWEWHQKKPEPQLDYAPMIQWWSCGSKKTAREDLCEPQIFERCK